MNSRWLRLCLGWALSLGLSTAHALTPADALALAAGDGDERIEALNRLSVDPDAKALALIQAMSNDAVKVQGEQVLIVADDGTATDAVTGAVVPLSDLAEDAMVNNRMRGALEAAAALRDVFGKDVDRQREAAALLQRSAFQEPDDAALPVLDKALAGELDAQARASLEQARAAMQLASEDEAQRLAAVQTLAGMGQRALRPLLMQQLEAETSTVVKTELQAALAALDQIGRAHV
jgi:urea transport system permease protein